jgi:hypothetical protein
VRFTAEVVKEYNRYMSLYARAWTPGKVDAEKASIAGFMCNAISAAVRASSHDGLKAAFEKGAYLEYKNTIYKVEYDGTTMKFEGLVLLPQLYKLGFLWVRTLQKHTRSDALDAAREVIDRLEEGE